MDTTLYCAECGSDYIERVELEERTVYVCDECGECETEDDFDRRENALLDRGDREDDMDADSDDMQEAA